MQKIDLTRLDDYLVIPLVAGFDAAKVKDLRELDQDFGNGVAALWSDEAQSILAFVFDRVLWDAEKARVWVRAAKADDVQAADESAGAGKGVKMPYRSMEEVNPAIRGIKPPVTLAQANMIAEWADAIQDAVDAPDNPWAVAIANFEKSYEVKDGAWVKRSREMWAFDSILADVGFDVAADSEGLVWKEIIRPGTWFKMDTGRKIEVTQGIIKAAYQAFLDGLPRFISVPADTHHSETRGTVPAEANRGFVQKLKMVGDALYGGFKFTDPQIAAGVQDGSIVDCSVYLQPDVFHPQTGKKYDWVLRHVLLTNNPLAQNLRPFGDMPISADGEDGSMIVIRYRQAPVTSEHAEVTMEPKNDFSLADADEIVLTGKAAQEYAQLATMGLSLADIEALVVQHEAVAARAEELRTKARALEVGRVVKALEGVEEHPTVEQVAGYRHYPAVIAAVEAALRAAGEDLAFDVDDDGVSGLDAVLLSVVNAIPADGRIKIAEGYTATKQDRALSGDDDPSDEEIDKLLAKIG